MKACNTTYYGNQTVRKSAPSAIFALIVGSYVPPDLRESGYVSPQHVLGTWAAAPSRPRASDRGFDVSHECYYVSLLVPRITKAYVA